MGYYASSILENHGSFVSAANDALEPTLNAFESALERAMKTELENMTL